jgi:hypothetical protein
MSAVLKSGRDSEQEFISSQQLPPEKRGISFEALFFRQLQAVTTRIHATENIDEIMLEASQDICKLFNADRLTLYAVNEDRSAIISKVKTGLNTSRDLKLPISPQSIAGYVAMARELVNISDVYDDEALKRIHPSLTFLKEVDKRSGYRTKQMLVVPILDGDVLHGVLQVCWWCPSSTATCCTACCRSSTTRATSPSASSRWRARGSFARRSPTPSASACSAPRTAPAARRPSTTASLPSA